MAIGTLAALAATKAIGSTVGYFAGRRNKPKKFGETAAGQFYRRIGAQGRISPTARSQILTRQGQVAGDVAQRRSADIRGYLASQGFGSSVAGSALVDAPQAGVQKQLGQTARDIEIQNELSKVGGQEAFARGQTSREDARRQFSAALNQNLIGGLTGAATDFIGGLQGFQQRESDLTAGRELTESAQANRIEIERIRQSGRLNENVALPANLSSFGEQDIKRFAFDNQLSEEEMLLLLDIWDTERQSVVIQ